MSLGTVTVELDTSGSIDIGAEIARAKKELAAAEKEIETTAAKLANENFIANAPDAVVDKIRARQQLANEDVARITKRLDELSRA